MTQAPERFRSIVGVHLLLRATDWIVLGRRITTDSTNGAYHPPAGCLEAGESVEAAVIREAWEECGIGVKPSDLTMVHVMHHSIGVAFFFETRNWEGEVTNAEPDKCEGWEWFHVDDPPSPMVPYARAALRAYTRGERFSTFGW